MRVLLDECVPVRLARELVGHEVASVCRRGWASLSDQDLVVRSAREFDVILTVDQNFQYQQALPPSLSLITVLVHSVRIRELRQFVPQILDALANVQPGQRIRIDPEP